MANDPEDFAAFAASRRRRPHSHCWIDPTDPPIERAPYSPVVGPGRRDMKIGTTYVCRECGDTVTPTGV